MSQFLLPLLQVLCLSAAVNANLHISLRCEDVCHQLTTSCDSNQNVNHCLWCRQGCQTYERALEKGCQSTCDIGKDDNDKALLSPKGESMTSTTSACNIGDDDDHCTIPYRTVSIHDTITSRYIRSVRSTYID